MNYEERYNQALEIAKYYHDRDNIHFLEHIFPELHESEDEKIRKALIQGLSELRTCFPTCPTFGGVKVEDILAWLERQCKQKSQGKSALEVWKDMRFEVYQQASGNRHEPNCSDDSTKMFSLTDIDEIFEKVAEKQSEQESTDEVKPKFKVGDWITNGEYTWKVTDIQPLDYILQSPNGDTVDDTISHVDEYFHLWTIQDAEDGDVLVANETIFMFKNIRHNMPYSYGGIDCTARFRNCIDEGGKDGRNWTTSLQDIYQATKKQCDILFSKMKEAGYECDAEKKELNKIEQNPSWSEEDERMLTRIINEMEAIKSNSSTILEKNIAQEKIDWLKSLKSHWKPSEEQMGTLNEWLKNHQYDRDSRYCYSIFQSLYNDLKTLI